MEKRCSKCHETKTLSEFHKASRDGYQSNCKPCALANAKAWYYTDKGHNDRLLRTYGITLDEYKDLLILQDGRCGICSMLPIARELVVDHDHATGRVRGLLCHRCNLGLGYYELPSFRYGVEAYLGA